MSDRPLYVTRPSLPSLEDYRDLMERVWDSRVLSNCGALHQELEEQLAAYLDVENVSLFNNATIALMAAFKALDLKGEVITTPFTYIASGQALLWCNLDPVFVDIDPETGNLDPQAVEAAVSPRTSAVFPVHCYGFPCDVQAIDRLAREKGLSVVYDAAQAFGTKINGLNLALAGDVSVYSFHATKVFNTFEGGLVVSSSRALKEKVDRIRNFGIDSASGDVLEMGLNGKMNEASAALGLLQLRSLEEHIECRQKKAVYYERRLSEISGVEVFGRRASDIYWNTAYFTVSVKDRPVEKVVAYLEREKIFPRRYFYPLLSDMDLFGKGRAQRRVFPCATRLSREILALPFHPDIKETEIDRVCTGLAEALAV